MASHLRTPVTAWLCLIIYLLAGVVGVQGAVICFGPGGHVAIEAFAAGDCTGCDSEAATGIEASTEQLAQLPVCPCSDIVLPGAGVLAQKLDSKTASSGVLRSLPASALWLQPIWSSHFGFRAADSIADARRVSSARSRSVVLLV